MRSDGTRSHVLYAIGKRVALVALCPFCGVRLVAKTAVDAATEVKP